MTYGLAIFVPLALLVAFLLLTTMEARMGRRVLPATRARLDAKVSRYMFIIRHVDWGALLSDLVRGATARITHDVAHTALIVVRSLERFLTRIVRTLRSREENPILPPPKLPEPPTRMERISTSVRSAVRRSRKRPTIQAPHVEEEE